jgi:hypothetical protein
MIFKTTKISAFNEGTAKKKNLEAQRGGTFVYLHPVFGCGKACGDGLEERVVDLL